MKTQERKKEIKRKKEKYKLTDREFFRDDTGCFTSCLELWMEESRLDRFEQ